MDNSNDVVWLCILLVLLLIRAPFTVATVAMSITIAYAAVIFT